MEQDFSFFSEEIREKLRNQLASEENNIGREEQAIEKKFGERLKKERLELKLKDINQSLDYYRFE